LPPTGWYEVANKIMVRSYLQYVSRAAAAAVVAALALPGLALAHTSAGTTPTWLSNDSKHHTATLTLVAAYTQDTAGFNFNGYSHGKMTITVPVNYTINVVFSNDAPLAHSVVFTAYSAKLASQSGFSPVFKGAESPNPSSGSNKGKTYRFSFLANKVGSYAIVCAVSGHAAAGMWDYFRVVKSGSASISISK